MRIIKKISLMTSLVVGLSVFADPTVSDITAKQRYPWNGLVDITCKVSGIEGKRKLVVSAVMPDSGKVVGLKNFWVVRNGEKSTNFEVSANGDYRFLWDAKADLGEVRHDNMVVRITLDDMHEKVQLWEGGPYWATTNIGAEKPEDYGYYFWWGDTVGYKLVNDKWVASDGSSSNFSFSNASLTSDKNTEDLYDEGWITTDGILAKKHDAANVHWGNGWQMPTESDFNNLNSMCDWKWTSVNGVKGYIVSGRDAYISRRIFLPCAGTAGGDADEYGYYWTSVPLPSYDYYHSRYFNFWWSGRAIGGFRRNAGFSIRPIQKSMDASNFSQVSDSFSLNTIGVPLNLELFSFNSSWIGGNANATVVIADNNVEVKRVTGEGEFTYSPITPGKHTLTYTTYIDDVVQSEVYSATVFVGWKYRILEGGIEITETSLTSGDIIIPSEIDGYPVVKIGNKVFANCKDLASVVIPDSVLSVAENTFEGCTGIESITYPSSLKIDSTKIGLVQAKFNTDSDIVSSVLNSPTKANVSGVLMGYAADESTPVKVFADPLYGGSYKWDKECTTFAYCGYMFMEAGRSYVFGKYFDDFVFIKIDGTVLIKDGDCYKFMTAVYEPKYTGWHSVDIRVADYTAVKGPTGAHEGSADYWSFNLGVAWRDDGITDALPEFGWKKLMDPGDGSLFRSGEEIELPWELAKLLPDSYSNIKEIVLTGSAEMLSKEAFTGCASLESISIPDGVGEIGDHTFAGCTSLKSIIIPESVTNVVVESKSLMDVDGAVAAYEFKGTLDDGTGYAPSGNGSFAADRFGIANSAYYFNGQEQQFVNTQKIVEGTFSFAFWFRTDVEMSSTGSSDKSGSGDGNYILFPKHGGVKRGYGAMVGTDGIKVMAHGDSYIAPVITYSNSIGSGWNHAVVTVSDNTNVKLYLNGEYVATGTGPSATAIFRVDAGGNYGFYTGYLDDLVVCDRALDNATVKELYSWTAASFAGCNGIVDVTMPGGLAESMAEMFPDSFASITNVVLTGGVAQIPTAAFSGCEALESVTLAESGATLALGGDKGWRFDENGVLRSGKITHNELSSMCMTVQSEGRLTYRWKASCEYYNRFILDYAYLSVDGVAKGEWNNYTLSGTAIGGNTDWQEISVDISGEDTHDIAWTFAKDDQDDASAIGEDCAWVDAITYEPFIKLTFDVGEGVGTVPALIKDVQGASVSLPKGEGFAKAKHTFVGWSDGVQTYAPGGAYEIGTANTVLTAVYSPNTLAAPVISSVDVASGCEITTAAARIEISAEGDTAIYYTLDGSTPTSGSLLYGGAFDAEGLGQVTVKAIAVRDNYFDSDVAEFTFTRRPYSAAECLNASAMTFTMSGDAEWSRVLDEASHDGDAALRSGAISHGNSCTIETKVVGPGTISFWWKVSSEIFRDWPLDIVSFTIDGVEHAWLGGVKDWTNIVVDIKAPGEHTLCWTYKKDDQGEAGEDCAWLDEVVWTPISDPIPELPLSATSTEVTAALDGSADEKLAANITTAAEYSAYRTWALGLAGTTPDQVKASPNAWLSYALDTDVLIAAAPKEGDIVIDTFESVATDGAFEFAVKIDGIAVGDNALEANIRKVFDIEGAEKLASGGTGFSSDNVEMNAAAPQDGNVKFTVTPKGGVLGTTRPASFFFRVKMK